MALNSKENEGKLYAKKKSLPVVNSLYQNDLLTKKLFDEMDLELHNLSEEKLKMMCYEIENVLIKLGVLSFKRNCNRL